MSRRSIVLTSVTTPFRSTTRGCSTCFRLNASSWRTSVAARCAARLISRRSSRRGSSRLDLPHQQLGVADDGGEEVVEVVRDAAGELADRLHLLRLTQLLLEALPLGHVADVDQEVQRSAGRVLHRRGVAVIQIVPPSRRSSRTV